jgi:hypothetical protein
MHDNPTRGADSQLQLRLLRRATFAAGYLPEVIDFIIREATGSEFGRLDDGQASRIHSRLVRYTAHGQPGASELARTMLDVRHAVDLVQHEHYRASKVPGQGCDTTVTAPQLLELAVAAGRESVLRTQRGTLVISGADGLSTVYRPVPADEAAQVRMAARSSKERAIRLHEQVVRALTPHVTMADWSRDEGYGVAADVVGEAVAVQWWPASLPETLRLWESGGIQELCQALLAPSFRVTADACQSLEVRA